MSAAAKAQARNSPTRMQRALVTPEGVDLKVMLADASQRASAFFLDVFFIVVFLVALTLVCVAGDSLVGSDVLGEVVMALWLLGFFVLRVFYFTAWEMTPRGATPGKRILGIRVATRDGGALTADAIFARNAMRELEIFLPLSFLASQAQVVDAWISIIAIVWCGIFALFPLLNKDRLRIGDLIAGTWVVRTPKRKLEADVAASSPQDAGLVFTQAALDAYGIHELSVLEDVLRRRSPETMKAVALRIRAKIGMADDATPDGEFLSAYYTALRRRLETKLLFGRRKKDKFDKS
ncbi:MAG TPA: RDD family protein [Rhizomicrobium sp.]|jgi:uncharacterized RDD family membrane protein YckC